MKKVLSLLMAFTFMHLQAYALSGGPVFSGTSTSFIGTYSGVLIPQSLDVTDTGTDSGASTSSVGLFTLSQPDVGTAVGAAVLFVDGAAFNCVVNGIIDPQDGRLRGIIDGTSTFTVTQIVPSGVDANGNVTFSTQDFSVSASGNIDAEVTGASSGVSTLPALATAAVPARIEGTASVDIFFLIQDDGTPDVSKTARFTVDGFKQSDVVSATTTSLNLNFNTGGGSTNNG